jgi:hypothetical protein
MPSAHAAVASGVGIIQSGLVFDFDAANPAGGTGTNMANLVTSNSGIFGTMQTGVSRSSSNGKTFLFDGSATSYATVPIGSTNFTSGFSLSFYAKFESPVANDRTFERVIDFANAAATSGDANSSMWVGRYIDTNDLSIEVWNGTTRPGNCRAINAITPGVFKHYVAVVNGSTCTFYVEKVAQTTTYVGSDFKNPPAVTRSSAFIGKSNWGDDPFKGEIGDIALYNSVLSQSDVNTNFTAQTDITLPSLSGSGNISVNENQTSVASLAASEPSTFTEYASGNHSLFSITSNGVVTLDAIANFEAPNPSNTLNYYFTLMDANGNTQVQMIVVTILDVQEFSSLSSPSLNATAYKGVNVTITVTPSTVANTAGKVTFLWNGKRIPKCFNITYSGTGTSTCTWKPASIGFEKLTVTFTPNKSNGLQEYAASTSTLTPFVAKRSTTR